MATASSEESDVGPDTYTLLLLRQTRRMQTSWMQFPLRRFTMTLIPAALFVYFVCRSATTITRGPVHTRGRLVGVSMLWNETLFRDHVWVPLHGWEQVVINEGPTLATLSATLRECEKACRSRPNCESFAACKHGGCYLKSQLLTGTEPAKLNIACTSVMHVRREDAYRPANSALLLPSTGRLHTFYMYRAQGDTKIHTPSNVNMASLGGVLWYLHNEIMCHCPRRFNITRLLRYKVLYRPTQPLVDKGLDFGARYAFDSGKCTGPFSCRGDSWDPYGYNVGCNDMVNHSWPFPTWKTQYPGAAWYSVPGECPSRGWGNKSANCKLVEPGGICTGVPTGAGNCTISFEEAGELNLDDVLGIPDSPFDSYHTEWCAAKNYEYSFKTDKGRGTNFWDYIGDWSRNQWRMNFFDAAFKRKYPNLPMDSDLLPPKCDFNRHTFYPKWHDAWQPKASTPDKDTGAWDHCVDKYYHYHAHDYVS